MGRLAAAGARAAPRARLPHHEVAPAAQWSGSGGRGPSPGGRHGRIRGPGRELEARRGRRGSGRVARPGGVHGECTRRGGRWMIDALPPAPTRPIARCRIRVAAVVVCNYRSSGWECGDWRGLIRFRAQVARETGQLAAPLPHCPLRHETRSSIELFDAEVRDEEVVVERLQARGVCLMSLKLENTLETLGD